MEYFKELLNILNAMSPYLLLGFFVAGLLHVFVPRTAYNKYLSKRGFKSVFLSALFGVPLPLCSCGVIPTAMSLKKEGASDGATVSFLIATPQTGIDSILATYGVFGLPFAIIRPIVAFVVGLLGGTLVNRFSTEERRAATQKGQAVNTNSDSEPTTFWGAMKYGFVDMIQDLGGWLAIGLVVAAAITAFVPSSIFELLNSYYLLNIFVVLLLSIPMYICSTGSIPIALSLLIKGISPGAALIFLMAGPATNVATLAVVRKVLGGRTTALYLLSIILGAIGFAIFIDFALPREWFTARLAIVAECAHGAGTTPWWHTASSVLFIALLANAYILKYWKGITHSHGVEEIATQSFKVSGMRCNHCKANTEKAIAALPNVLSVTIELSSGVVEVVGDVPEDDVRRAITQLGFEVERL
ncbi:MAG: permease [Rikenellaceae bacterium]